MASTIANPNPVQVIGRASECMRRLMEAGLTYEALQAPIDDPEMRGRLVRFWLNDGFEPSVSQSRAREIMGANFFGIQEAITHFGVNPSKRQLAYLAEVPFTEEVLRSVKDTHILVAVFPIPILEIRGKVDRQLFFSHEDAWYNKEAFAKERGQIEWRLVRKTPVPDSTSKTWGEQQALLGEADETPTAQVMAYTIIGHFLASGERLFENIYVRCSDVDSVGDRVYVGYFDAGGLDVSYWRDGRSDDVGLGSARKCD